MLSDLLTSNRFWAQSLSARNPDYFPSLARQQSPNYFWIGCSDSRVPANEVVGLMPGELFVHRNVANMVVATDMNLLSALQYAVDMLKVEHIIVCGHYGCGGVRAALSHHIDEQIDLLCQLNVKRQVTNVCHTTIVQNAWHRGQKLSVHGWIYGLKDGLIHDLEVSVHDFSQLKEAFVYEV